MKKDIYSARRSMMAKIPVMKEKDLKEESVYLYDRKLAEDNKLLEAYKQKKVKSKAAIRRAEAIITARKKKSEEVTS